MDYKLIKEAHKVDGTDKVFWRFSLKCGSSTIAIKPSFESDRFLLSLCAVINADDDNDYKVGLVRKESKTLMKNGKPFSNYYLNIGWRYFAIKPVFDNGYKALYFFSNEGAKDVKAE